MHKNSVNCKYTHLSPGFGEGFFLLGLTGGVGGSGPFFAASPPPSFQFPTGTLEYLSSCFAGGPGDRVVRYLALPLESDPEAPPPNTLCLF